MTYEELIKGLEEHGACYRSREATNIMSLSKLVFTAQGREYIRNSSYPTLDIFRALKRKIEKNNIYIDKDIRYTNKSVVIVGDSTATLNYVGLKGLYKVILLYGAKAKINVSNYAVVLIDNIGGSYEINNDGTGRVLL